MSLPETAPPQPASSGLCVPAPGFNPRRRNRGAPALPSLALRVKPIIRVIRVIRGPPPQPASAGFVYQPRVSTRGVETAAPQPSPP
jgi:hypothetical protein